MSQLKREANKRRRNGPGRLDAGDEIAGDLRYPADPASPVALANGFLVTRSNATPMLIALTALIAVAMGAASGVHLLSKEARS